MINAVDRIITNAAPTTAALLVRWIATLALSPRRRPIGLALLLALSLSPHSAQAMASSADAVVPFKIPSADLASALQRWATQSKVQVVYAPELVKGRRSRAVDGFHTPAQALEVLLRGSGVQAVSTGAQTWLLRAARPSLPTQPAPKPVAASIEAEAPAPQMSPISVYSRPLQRIAEESSIPITVITRTDIESSGYLSLFDLLRSQPGVQVTHQPERMGGNAGAAFETGASGAASVGLRRLGAKATLILINGRRMASYGLAADATGSVADISAIPLAMVERIDILRDGASTLFGADAMAGVIDISLRTDFSGGEIGAVLGASGRSDVLHRQVSGSIGRNLANDSNIVVMLDLLDRDPLPGDHRDWYTLDRSSEGLSDARSVFSFPGNREIIDADGNPILQSRRGCRSADLDAAGVCRDDRAKATSLATGKRAATFRAYYNQPLAGGAEVYADVGVISSRQFQQSAPTSARITIADDDGGIAQQVDHAFWDVGPVRQATHATVTRLDAGIRHAGERWNWDFSLSGEQSRVEDDIDGLVNRDGFLTAASRLGYRFDQRPAPAEIASLLAPQVTNSGRSQTGAMLGVFSGELAQWKHGSLLLDSGFEWRSDNLLLEPDASLVSGDLLIAQPVAPFRASRNSGAVYGRLDASLLRGLNADVALRIEHVDGHGSFAAPAFALRWQPWESLLLRMGTADGRRTPTLLEQRGLDEAGGASTYEFRVVPDALLPCAQAGAQGPNQCFLELRPTSGPPLRSEQSRSINAGLVWQASSELSVSLDVYELHREGEIDLIPIAYALQNSDYFPGFLHYDAQGRLSALNLRRVNLGTTSTRGADMALHWRRSTQDFGVFDFRMGVNRLGQLSFEATPDSQGFDRAGYASHPRLTASASLRWTMADWSTTLGLRHTGGYRYEQFDGDSLVCPQYRAKLGRCSTPGFALVNLNVAYAGFTDWRVALSVSNLFDHQPRYYNESSGGYNALFDDPVGRYFSISARRDF